MKIQRRCSLNGVEEINFPNEKLNEPRIKEIIKNVGLVLNENCSYVLNDNGEVVCFFIDGNKRLMLNKFFDEIQKEN